MEIQWAWIAWSLVCLLLAVGLSILAVKEYPKGDIVTVQTDLAALGANITGLLGIVFLVISLILVNKGAPWFYSAVFP